MALRSLLSKLCPGRKNVDSLPRQSFTGRVRALFLKSGNRSGRCRTAARQRKTRIPCRGRKQKRTRLGLVLGSVQLGSVRRGRENSDFLPRSTRTLIFFSFFFSLALDRNRLGLYRESGEILKEGKTTADDDGVAEVDGGGAKAEVYGGDDMATTVSGIVRRRRDYYDQNSKL